jgi:arginyl-tRNA synthetase
VTPAKLSEVIVAAAHAAFAERGLDRAGLPESTTVRRPRDPGRGDYASTLALQLAGTAGVPPGELAAALADHLGRAPGIMAVEVVDPGFLNIRLAPAVAGDLARIVVQAGRAYGQGILGYRHSGAPAGELVDAIGVDAARYALARHAGPPGPHRGRAADATSGSIDIDVELWGRASEDNPVYRVQYVAARTASVARNAAQLGLHRGGPEDFQPELLTHRQEGELLKALGEFPGVVSAAARRREPHRVPYYLERLADAFQRFHSDCRILPQGDEEITAAHRARLWLNDATRTVIANGLRLLGVRAPVRI